MSTSRHSSWILLPILSGFFIMGAPAGIISTAMERIRADFQDATVLADALPFMAFVWFLLVSIPTGVLCGKAGRRNTVLLALLTTVAAMLLPFAAGAGRLWPYCLSFACLGIGNTMIQASLPALVSNVVPPDQITSRLSLGQFVKAICGTVTPMVALACAGLLGNWKLLFLAYGLLAAGAAAWLFCAKIPREEATGPKTSFRSCVAIGFANAFGMCMGLAIDRRPDKANEISALMVMAICGGGISTFLMGVVRQHGGARGMTFVLLACLAYLLVLGLFAARRVRTKA